MTWIVIATIVFAFIVARLARDEGDTTMSETPKGTIIDRSNWQALKVWPGDLVLNALGKPYGEVVRVGRSGRRSGIVTVRTKLGGTEFEYQLDNGRSCFEYLIEFKGFRFLRPEPLKPGADRAG